MLHNICVELIFFVLILKVFHLLLFETFNNSKNSRVSLDCRGLAYREYDTDKLSDTIIKSKNINFQQSEYFSVGQYYMEV